jgi:hypothetical protein
MELAVRGVSVINDRGEMLDLLKRNLPDPPELGFEWRYLRNPAGQACSWFLYEKGSSRAVGMASLFPRMMWVDGKPVMAGQVMHFVVDAGYRSLGPAVLLQRATFEPIDQGVIDFCYDCPPHDQGMTTFARLRMAPSCEVIRYALLLRSDGYLEKRMGSGRWTKPVAIAVNLLLRKRRTSHKVPGLEIQEFTAPFDAEFSALDKSVSTKGVVTRCRSAEELNWRYRENPEHRYQVLVARRGGELCGFAVFVVQSEGVASLMELFGPQLAEVGVPLLNAVIETCRRQRLWAVYGYCSEESEMKSLFAATGFRRRERAARVVPYANAGSAVSHRFSRGLRWSFSHAELSG